MLRRIWAAILRDYNYRRLIEFDASQLLQKYGTRAGAYALEFEGRGKAFLSGDQREGHWARVARCISGRPLPIRSETVLG